MRVFSGLQRKCLNLIRDLYKHPSTLLRHNSNSVQIDNAIVSLITLIWRCGIQTNNSCQDHCSLSCSHKREIVMDGAIAVSKPIRTPNCKNHIWLSFCTIQDLEKFLSIVQADELDDSMRLNSVVGRSQVGEWAYEFFLLKKGGSVVVVPQLTFPKSHLEIVEASLKKALTA